MHFGASMIRWQPLALSLLLLGTPAALALGTQDSGGDDPGTCVVASGDACGTCDTSTCIAPGAVLVCETSDSKDACLCDGLPDLCSPYWLLSETPMTPPCSLAATACQSACGQLPDVVGDGPTLPSSSPVTLPQESFEVDACDPGETAASARALDHGYAVSLGQQASDALDGLYWTPTPYPPASDPTGTGLLLVGGDCSGSENAAWCTFTPTDCHIVFPGDFGCAPGPFVCAVWVAEPAPGWCILALNVDDAKRHYYGFTVGLAIDAIQIVAGLS